MRLLPIGNKSLSVPAMVPSISTLLSMSAVTASGADANRVASDFAELEFA
jgi:hypothetical protein